MRALLNMKWFTWVGVLAVAGLVGCGGSGSGGGNVIGEIESLFPDLTAEQIELIRADCDALNAAAKEEGDDPICRTDADCVEDDDECVSSSEIGEAATLNPHSKFPATLGLGFKQIRLEKPDKAKTTLEPKIDAENEPETYTYMLASLKAGIDSIAGLLNTISGQFAPGLLPSQGTDFKAIVNSVLNPIIENLETIADTAPIIRASADAWVNIPTVPLGLDLSTISSDLPSDIDLDIGGGYDRAEILALGAASDGIAGALDYVLAHKIKLKLDSIDLLTEELSSGSIAEFAIENGELLALDSDVSGIADASDAFIRALDLATGTDGGGDGEAGLLVAIESELGEDQTGDVIIFNDEDGDGEASEGDTITITFIEDIIDDFDELEEGDQRIEIPVGRGSWVGLTGLGRALQGNLESGGGPVSIAEYLEKSIAGGSDDLLWDHLQNEVQDNIDNGPEDADDFDFSDVGPLVDMPDLLHLNPKEYFDDPVGVRNLLPAILEYDEDQYEIAINCEIGYTADEWANPSEDGLEDGSLIRGFCGTTTESTDMLVKQIFFLDTVAPVTDDADAFIANGGDAVTDFVHFTGIAFAADDGNFNPVTGANALTDPTQYHLEQDDVDFAEGMGTDDLEVEPDGYRPTTTNADVIFDDIVVQMLFQNPDLGGTLELTLAEDGSGVAPASNNTLNAMIAKITFDFGGHIEELVSTLLD